MEHKMPLYLNKKTLPPILIFPSSSWINNITTNVVLLRWRYMDSDLQKDFHLQISKDNLFTDIVSEYYDHCIFSNESDKKIYSTLLSDAYPNIINDDLSVNNGVYYWRVRVKGTHHDTSDGWSDFSYPRQLKIDVNTPIVESVDVVYISDISEYHSNLKQASNQFKTRDGIFISHDEYSNFLSIDICYPFDATLSIDNKKRRPKKRTYFIDVYFPDLQSTSDMEIVSHADMYVQKGIFDPSDISSYPQMYGSIKFNDSFSVPKISASLFVNDENINPDIILYSQEDQWSLKFPSNNMCIIRCFYIEEDYIGNIYKNYISVGSSNAQFNRNYIFQSLYEAVKPINGFVFKPDDIKSALNLIKIGSCLTPPNTYVDSNNNSANILPQYCFSLGFNSIKKMELIDNGYYRVNSSEKNTILTLGNVDNSQVTSEINLDLKSSSFDNFRKGDIFSLLNSHFSFKNSASKANEELNIYRNFRNHFEIKDIDSVNKKLYLSGIDRSFKYINERQLDPDGNLFTGTISYDNTTDISTVKSDTMLSSLSFSSEGGKDPNDHALTNFFIGINENEFPILDNTLNSISVDGNILDYLNIEDGSSIDFYISGDSYSIYTNSLFMDKNVIRIFVRSSNNFSGIKGIKAIESIPYVNLYDFNELEPPNNIRYSLIKSNSGNISGPAILYYNFSSVTLKLDHNFVSVEKESVLSNTIKIVIPDNNHYYVNFIWNRVIDKENVGAHFYRIYGRTKDENTRYLISNIKYDSITPNSNMGDFVSWNDYGEIEYSSLLYNSSIFDSEITNLLPAYNENNGFLSGDDQTYEYIVSSFKIVNGIFYYGSASGTSTSISISNNSYNNSVYLTWTKPSGCDGYRVFGRSYNGNKILLNTIFNPNEQSYEDPGLSYTNKNLTLTTNIKYSRSSSISDSSFIFHDSLFLNNVYNSYIEDGVDVKYIDYVISNKDRQFLDLYFIIQSNSLLTSSSSLEDLETISISKRLPETKCIYDAIAPVGNLKVYNLSIPQSNTGTACLDFSSFTSITSPLNGVSFSNFKNNQYTPMEYPYTTNKYWKFGYDVIMQISSGVNDSYWSSTGENSTYGISTDGNDSFAWAKIPVVNSSDFNNPTSSSSIKENIFNILGKKIYISTKDSDSESMSCLDFTHIDTSGNGYTLLVKIKSLSLSSIVDYLKENLKSGTKLIACTTEYEKNEDISFYGVNGYLTNSSSIPYRMVSYPNIDFKESLAPEYEPLSIGDFPRNQYSISNLLLEGSRSVNSVWYGYFYINYDGLYIFSVGSRGNKVSLFLDDNVDYYYRYLNNSSATVYTKSNNIKYRIISGSDSDSQPNTYIEHIYSEQNSALMPTNSELISLKTGWHKFRLQVSYQITESQTPIRNNVLCLFYQAINNDIYNMSYPKISNIDTSNNSFEYNFPDDYQFNNNSIMGNICLIGNLNPYTGSNSNDQDRSNMENYLQDLGVIEINNQKYRKLKLEITNPTLFSISQDDHFDFIQPNVKKLSFAPIKKTSISSSEAVLYLNEEELPRTYFSGEEITSYRLFKWVLKIKSNENNKIYFSNPITGTIINVIEDTTNNLTKIYAVELISSYYYLDFYGYPVFFNNDSSSLYQVLLVGDGYFEINGILPNSSNYVGSTYCIGSLRGLVNNNDTFFVNLGRALSTFRDESLNKNCLPVYIKAYDRFSNETTSKLLTSIKSSFNQNNVDSQVYSGSVIEYYINGSNKNQYVVTNIGSQVYDANIIEKSIGIYESEIIVGGSGFSFWKEISWDADILEDDDVLIEIRTAPTEEELLNKTYNENAFGINLAPFNILSFDVPEINPTGVNIISFTSNGQLDADNKVIKNKFLQFRITLRTSSSDFSPKVNSVTVTYNTSSSVFLMSKNFTLSSNITGGILTANTYVPEGTSIEWGINTEDSTDFDRFYKINIDEAFDIPENLRNDQFKIGCVMTSSKDNVPKIYEIAFQFTCEDSEELLNLDL